MATQARGQGSSPYSNMQPQHGASYTQNHPLNHQNSTPQYPAANGHSVPHSNYHNATPQQMEQLQLQRQHQQQLEEQFQTEESIRMQQHRVARPAAAAVGQDRRATENKLNGYNAFPTRPNGNDSSAELTDLPKENDTSLKARLQHLYKFPCTIYGKALMGVIALEALLVIIMQVIIVVKYFHVLRDTPVEPEANEEVQEPHLDSRNQSRSIPAYLIVFVFAQLFQFVLAWDAVRAQNTIEMIAIVSFNLCCFAYSIFEISQTRTALEYSQQFLKTDMTIPELARSLNPYLIVVVIVIGLTQCIITWLAYRLFQEFGWRIYKKIGADPNMKKMYRAYQIYLVLIKIDMFFFVGFSIQFIYLTLTRRSEDPEYWLTIIVLPLTVLILYVAVYAVRHESRKWMTTFIIAMLCGVAYFVFKVVRMYFGDKVTNYAGVVRFLTLFASLCLLTILATIANAAVCYRNFGKGLKAQITKDSRGVADSTSSTGGRFLMEID